jgi:molybdate transport system substrate-binding protein
MRLLRAAVLIAGSLLVGCSGGSEEHRITVAAASNLNPVIAEIGKAFTEATGVMVVNSYASTAQLAQQIENGAPFDVFAAADTEHVDALVHSGKLRADTRAIYARGKLVLWVADPARVNVKTMRDLLRPEIRLIAIANPKIAPYGKASLQALQAAGLWAGVEQKITYAANINLARQYADSGNADAAFTAYSLVIHSRGRVIQIDPALYDPLDQALAVLSSSKKPAEAREFAVFMAAGAGAEILQRYGYEVRLH